MVSDKEQVVQLLHKWIQAYSVGSINADEDQEAGYRVDDSISNSAITLLAEDIVKVFHKPIKSLRDEIEILYAKWIPSIPLPIRYVEHVIQGHAHLVIIVLADGSCYGGFALCSPKDQYNRKLGYRIALGRALKSATVPTNVNCMIPNIDTLSKKEIHEFLASQEYELII